MIKERAKPVKGQRQDGTFEHERSDKWINWLIGAGLLGIGLGGGDAGSKRDSTERVRGERGVSR